MNFTLYMSNSIADKTIDISTLCPDAYNIYMSWFTSFVIILAITMFSWLALYIIMDLRITKLLKEKKEILESSQKCKECKYDN